MSTPNDDANKRSSPNDTASDSSPSAMAYAIGILVLGTSAGFMFYTKKSGSMLQGMHRMKDAQLRRNPPKTGPPTKEQWEKTRPRIDKDEFF